MTMKTIDDLAVVDKRVLVRSRLEAGQVDVAADVLDKAGRAGAQTCCPPTPTAPGRSPRR